MNVVPFKFFIYDALHHSVSFKQLKKCEKHPQRNDTLVLGKLRKLAKGFLMKKNQNYIPQKKRKRKFTDACFPILHFEKKIMCTLSLFKKIIFFCIFLCF